MRVHVVEAGTGRGIEHVAVTCGDDIVLTAADGQARVEPDPEDRFVWISRPAGRRPVDAFYRALPADEDVVFELADDPDSRPAEKPVRMVQFTDTHVVGPGQRVSAPDLAEALAHLVEESAPDLLVASGDLTNLGSPEELAELQAGLAALTVPLFPMFGGHDGNAERRTPDSQPPWTRNWEACFGPAYYSFDWGALHIVLWPNEDGFFAPAERERKRRWLEADLALHGGAGTTILVTHHPPPSQLVDRVAALGVQWILHGHWHSVKTHRRAGVTVAAAPPLCFGGIDTSPRGYRLVEWAPSGSARTRVAALGGGRLQPSSPLTVGDFGRRWETRLTEGDDALTRLSHRAAPVIDGERLLIAASREIGGAVRCLDMASGRDLWTTPTEAPVRNAVAVSDGRALALAMTGALYCLDTDGRLQWRVELGGHPERWLYTSPAVADGVVYAGGKAGLGAWDLATGERRWQTPLEASDAWSSYASPLVIEGLVVLQVARRGLLALSRADGAIVWEATLDVEYPYAQPVSVGDAVVAGGARSHLARLRLADGSLEWHLGVLEGAHAAGMSTDGERLYTASCSGCVQSLRASTGDEVWRLTTDADRLDMTPYARGIASVLAPPTPLTPTCLLVGANDGQLRVVDAATGGVRAQADFGAPLTAAPARVADGGFVLTTWDGRVLRYGPA